MKFHNSLISRCLILTVCIAIQGVLSEGDECQTKYKTVNTKECRTGYDKKCVPQSRIVYQTTTEKVCDTIYKTNCIPVPRSVEDEECVTEYDEVQIGGKCFDIFFTAI